jgi:UDP:flavonoid glycosyltransferase YjiC (YdhE family)
VAQRVWPLGIGKAPAWPNASGAKIYAYLKTFPGLELLLQSLTALGNPAIIFGREIAPDLLRRYACPHLRFEFQPLDLCRIAAECDLALIHGTHGTAATLLLAGKPCLLMPLFTEQLIFSKKVEQLGAARVVPKTAEAELPQLLEHLLQKASYGLAARQFAQRYDGFRPGQQVPELVTRLEAAIRRA